MTPARYLVITSDPWSDGSPLGVYPYAELWEALGALTGSSLTGTLWVWDGESYQEEAYGGGG